jgi:hypothetical protein
MVTNRFITKEDYDTLAQSLKIDEHHNETPPEFFYEDGTVCSVYEDEEGPVLFARGAAIEYGPYKVIQLDIQYLNNMDARRNMRAMLEGFPELEDKAKANGFAGFVFISQVPLLRKFCVKRLGFEQLGEDVLIKRLRE